MKLIEWSAIFCLVFSAACTEHCDRPEPAADAAGAPDGTLVGDASSAYALDPDTLRFYDLPINSVRYAVSGLEPTLNLCVTLVWFINELSNTYHLCGLDPAPQSMRPYAIVAPVTPVGPPGDGPQYGAELCEVWDYQPNATVQDLVGCADFAGMPATSGSADLVVTLDSPSLQGPVLIRSP